MNLDDHLRFAELLPEAVFLIAPAGTVLAANKAAAELLETQAETLRGKALAELVLDPREKVAQCLRLWSRSSQMALNALEWRKPDGNSVPCRCDGALFRAGAPDHVSMIVVRCWPKEQERMIKRFGALNEKIFTLKQINEQLESRVAQRTDELTRANAFMLQEMERRKEVEAELLQSQKMKSLGTLAAGIAHDFNNHLNIILGYASLIADGQLEPDDLRESVAVIKSAAEKGSEVVRHLLTVARKEPFNGEPVPIAPLVENVAALVGRTFPRTIEIKQDNEKLAAVLADRNQLQQVLLNLSLNARDAMPFGGTLFFRSRIIAGADVKSSFPEAEAETYVCLSVSDTGVGMDDDVKARIFEPFYTTKEIGEGTGLGLAVVYGIVTNHRGFIGVHSGKGQGTSFEIYLPALPALPAGVNGPAAADRAAAAKASGTVLVVDDEPSQLVLMKKVLNNSGYRVFVASDGAEAVDCFGQYGDQIDVVLLDVGLPKMDGYQVMLRIRNQNPRVKIVLATGYLDPESRIKMADAGVKHIIDKPYVPAQVAMTIRELMTAEAPRSETRIDE